MKHITTPIVTFHDSDDVSLAHRLSYQLGALLAHPRALATTARWQRVSDTGETVHVDGRRERAAAITLMMHREPALRQIGFFDTVRISADTEYMSRIRHKLGRHALYAARDVLYHGLLRDGSLTRGAQSGFLWTGPPSDQRRELTGDRLAYHNSFKAWHRGGEGYKKLARVGFPVDTRPFEAPSSLLRNCDDTDMDVVETL